jgi:hypothetical protein
MTMPPIGRVMKPTPNVATDKIRLMKGSFEGKKCSPIITAKKV